MPRKAKKAFEVQTGMNPRQMQQILAHYDQQKPKHLMNHHKGSTSIQEVKDMPSVVEFQPAEPSRPEDMTITDCSPSIVEHVPLHSHHPPAFSNIRLVLSLHSAESAGMICARIKPISSGAINQDQHQPDPTHPNKPSQLVVIRDNTELQVPANLSNETQVTVELLDASGRSCYITSSLVDGSHQILTLPEFGNSGLLVQTFAN